MPHCRKLSRVSDHLGNGRSAGESPRTLPSLCHKPQAHDEPLVSLVLAACLASKSYFLLPVVCLAVLLPSSNTNHTLTLTLTTSALKSPHSPLPPAHSEPQSTSWPGLKSLRIRHWLVQVQLSWLFLVFNVISPNHFSAHSLVSSRLILKFQL